MVGDGKSQICQFIREKLQNVLIWQHFTRFLFSVTQHFSFYLHIFPSSPLFPQLHLSLWSSPEADDLAQYLDHLLAHAAPKKPKQEVKGLGRFKAVATKTKEMVSLMNKAQDLNVHSE